MKKVAILGSTGSIGTQTLEIIRDNEDLQAVALAAGQNVDLMEKQIREFHPQIAGMWSEEEAWNGREAVEKYAANPQKFDVILMDLMMPVMGGLEAAFPIPVRSVVS